MPSKFCEHLVEDEANRDDDIMKLARFMFIRGVGYSESELSECKDWEVAALEAEIEEAIAAWKAREVESWMT
jgi:hypothetical protein